ncbi:hypothetical protein EI94DRAFT_1695765 [Lactarius quietus]|nr:hypothetical protein EI94DRAFT_1695765 [Lactarius quietus]
MSASATIATASPLSPSLSNKHDPALKPNPHPYAIKTTSTGILTRSNSSGHNTPSRYLYTPPPGTPSRSPTKPTREYRSHRHSASLTNELPLPLPSPLVSFPVHSQCGQSEDDVSLCRQRADTLPSYLPTIDAVSAEPEEDLPSNPKTWTPTQLSVYLTAALRVRSGARLPERVSLDITSWVRREAVTGRTFLRWTDEDLKALGVNTLWRGALLAAARNLRQNLLRGRIWGTPTSEPEQEEENGSSLSYPSPSSSSPDLPLADANADTDTRPHMNANGRVRGMVDKWERGSASSRSSSRCSNHRRSESEPGFDADLGTYPNATISPPSLLPFPSKVMDDSEEPSIEDLLAAESASPPLIDGSDASTYPTASTSPPPPMPFPSKLVGDSEEPSIEDLLAAESASSLPMDSSWGARAWEELDIGVTVRRVDPAHDTVVPRRDGNGSGSGSSSTGSRGNDSSGSNNSSQRARRTVVDIFADPVDVDPSSALTADAGVQATEMEDRRAAEAEAEAEAELEAKERALLDEVRGAHVLLEELKRRLEEVETRVGTMEAEWRAKEERPQATLKTHSDKAVEASEFFHDPTPPPLPEVIPVPPTPTDETPVSSDASCASDADSESGVVSRAVGLVPETVSDLPSYVFLVGLGVCTVVLQVVLKRVAGRSLKS